MAPSESLKAALQLAKLSSLPLSYTVSSEQREGESRRNDSYMRRSSSKKGSSQRSSRPLRSRLRSKKGEEPLKSCASGSSVRASSRKNRRKDTSLVRKVAGYNLLHPRRPKARGRDAPNPEETSHFLQALDLRPEEVPARRLYPGCPGFSLALFTPCFLLPYCPDRLDLTLFA